MEQGFVEKRSESRDKGNQFYSVEFLIEDMGLAYQFKIWDVSSRGMCVMVRPDSDILSHLKVGDVLNMKYYKSDTSTHIEYLKTEIKHITKDETGRFKNHYLV
ncbi:MAG: hypothetical protein JRI56_07750, partial [Deltaproteobacteria bacterium]|nr:hypothetical protein [Deltaproteobacteria bacterium]